MWAPKSFEEQTDSKYISPFSTIGMPHYRERLLSAWGNDRIFEVGHPAPKSFDVPSGARRGPGNIGYIMPNPNKGHRNQNAVATIASANGGPTMGPRYPSGKSQASINGETDADDAQDMSSPLSRLALSDNTGESTQIYEELTIEYGGSRGVQDFDFGCV